MRILSIVSTTTFLFAGVFCLAQTATPHPNLSDTMAMKVDITYDKPIYLIGEEMLVTISVTNPTNRVAHIIEPFQLNAGGVYIEVEVAPGYWSTLIDHPSEICWTCGHPIITLRPSETRTFSFLTADGCTTGAKAFIHECLSVQKPGTYNFTYWYGSHGKGSFKVETATVLEAQEVAHKTPLRVPRSDAKGQPTGNFWEYPRADAAFILEAGGKRYVALTSRAHNGIGPFAPGTVLLGHHVLRAGPYRLIDESTEEITDLKFSSDEKENFRVTYNRGREVGRTLRFDSSRKLIPEKE